MVPKEMVSGGATLHCVGQLESMAGASEKRKKNYFGSENLRHTWRRDPYASEEGGGSEGRDDLASLVGTGFSTFYPRTFWVGWRTTAQSLPVHYCPLPVHPLLLPPTLHL